MYVSLIPFKAKNIVSSLFAYQLGNLMVTLSVTLEHYLQKLEAEMAAALTTKE